MAIWELGYESRDETLNEHLLGCVGIAVEGALSRKKMGKDGGGGWGGEGREEKGEKHRGAKRRREGCPTQCGQRDENQQSRINSSMYRIFFFIDLSSIYN